MHTYKFSILPVQETVQISCISILGWSLKLGRGRSGSDRDILMGYWSVLRGLWTYDGAVHCPAQQWSPSHITFTLGAKLGAADRQIISPEILLSCRCKLNVGHKNNSAPSVTSQAGGWGREIATHTDLVRLQGGKLWLSRPVSLWKCLKVFKSSWVWPVFRVWPRVWGSGAVVSDVMLADTRPVCPPPFTPEHSRVTRLGSCFTPPPHIPHHGWRGAGGEEGGRVSHHSRS